MPVSIGIVGAGNRGRSLAQEAGRELSVEEIADCSESTAIEP